MAKIVQVESGEQLEAVRELFLEYAEYLGFDLEFQDFSDELSNLPGYYSSPRGRILLALENNRVAGCVALRELSDDTCEMKRLYVRPNFRGKGIGRSLAVEIIEEAKAIGYSKMQLDTVSSMKEASALYTSLGFYEIEPYRFNPLDDALFFELMLT